MASDGKVAVQPGGIIVYALAYANLGGSSATNVKITETVPANTRFVLAQSLLGWSCADASPAGSTCTFNVGTLAAGARGSALFAVLQNGTTSPVNITHTVRIGSANVDANPANNTSAITTPLILSSGSAVTPLLECVMDRGANANPRYTAVFGYDNPNTFAKSMAVGSTNKFAPNPQDRGQTTVFLPGRQHNAFFVDFSSGTLTWTLSAKTVAASFSSTRCASTAQVVSGVAFFDNNGNGLRDSAFTDLGLPFIIVNLMDASGAVIDTRITALDGSYSFVADNPLGRFVQVIRPPLTKLKFTAKNANGGGNDTNDSVIDPVTWQSADLGTLPNSLRGRVNVGLKP